MFEARVRTSCNNIGSQSNCSLLKCWVCIINEKKLSLHCAVFCMRLNTLENLNVAKTVSGMFMFMHFYRLFELGAVSFREM